MVLLEEYLKLQKTLEELKHTKTNDKGPKQTVMGKSDLNLTGAHTEANGGQRKSRVEQHPKSARNFNVHLHIRDQGGVSELESECLHRIDNAQLLSDGPSLHPAK